MLLEAMQKAAKASAVRSNDRGTNRRCEKRMPTKSARFLIHCWGRRAAIKASTRSASLWLGSVVVTPLAVGEAGSPRGFGRSSCVVIVLPKNAQSLQYDRV